MSTAIAAAPTTILRGRRLVGAAGRGLGIGSGRAVGCGARCVVVLGPAVGGVIQDKNTLRTAITAQIAGRLVDRVSELPAALEAVSGSGGQGSHEHTIQPSQLRALIAQFRRRTAQQLPQRSGRSEILGRRCPGQQVKGGGRQRVLIGTSTHIGAHQLFGRGVAHRAGRNMRPDHPQ